MCFDNFRRVVVPSDYRVHLGALHRISGRDVDLATEPELMRLCPDCEEGALPPVGGAYGLKSMVDKGLLMQPEINFEAGGHEHLVNVTGPNFQALHAGSETVEVARHV